MSKDSKEPRPRIESFSLNELQVRLGRAVKHREKLDAVARLVELEKENEALEEELSEHIPDLESEIALEPLPKRSMIAERPARPAVSPLVSRLSSEPVADEASRPEGWRGEKIRRTARIHETKRLETLIEREAREAAQIRWIPWLVAAILSGITSYVLLPIHLLYRSHEYAALLPSHSRRLIVRGTASTALGLAVVFCLVLVVRALLRRFKARRRLAALAEDVDGGLVEEELIEIMDLSLVNDLNSDYPAVEFELRSGGELELTDYFGLFHPEDLGDRILLVRSPGCGVLLDLVAAPDLFASNEGTARGGSQD